jgi:hypothetical protein
MAGFATKEPLVTYKGFVKNGVIVLDEPAALKDGDRVSVRPLRTRRKPSPKAAAPLTLYERLKDVAGIVKGMPSDFARNHDHYIHGTPKR